MTGSFLVGEYIQGRELNGGTRIKDGSERATERGISAGAHGSGRAPSPALSSLPFQVRVDCSVAEHNIKVWEEEREKVQSRHRPKEPLDASD